MSLEGEGGMEGKEGKIKEGGRGGDGGRLGEEGEGRGDCYAYSNIIQWHQSI